MERERLTQLLKTPDRVAREDLADLRSLVARYPWFSGAQVLQASGEGFAGDVRSDETLNIAAAHVPSRAVLFDIAKSSEDGLFCKSAPPVRELPVTAADMPPENRAPVKPQPEKPVVVAPEAVAVSQVKLPSAGISNEVSTPEAVVEVPEAVVEMDVTVAAPAVVAPCVELPSAASREEEVAPEPVVEALDAVSEVKAQDPLERQILEAALASAYDLTLHHPVPTPVVQETRKSEELPVVSSTLPISKLQVEKATEPVGESPSAEPSAENVQVAPTKPQPVTRGTRKLFSSWLDAAPVIVSVPPPIATTTAQVKESPAPPPSVADAHAPVSPVAAMPSAEERKSIVDRFIEQEIQPVAAKKEFFTPQQAAKRSLDDTVGLVTETLAAIYAKQGNIAKAKDAYRKLALKYPEKSAYFAGLLQTLEAQQNK